MLEVNCDDSLGVMKRLKEHRPVIIRDNKHDTERQRERQYVRREREEGQETVQENKRQRGACVETLTASEERSSGREKNTFRPSTE